MAEFPLDFLQMRDVNLVVVILRAFSLRFLCESGIYAQLTPWVEQKGILAALMGARISSMYTVEFGRKVSRQVD